MAPWTHVLRWAGLRDAWIIALRDMTSGSASRR